MKILSLLLCSLLVLTASAQKNNTYFIENVGQITDQFHQPRTDLDFSLSSKGVNMLIGNGRIEYLFAKAIPDTTVLEQNIWENIMPSNRPKASKLQTQRLEVTLVNANKNAKAIKEGRLKYYEHYYYPHLGENGAVAYSYSKITYAEVYPHIDWVIYLNEGQLEYEFIVKEGGNPADIQLKYDGSSGLRIDSKGDIIAETPLGTITENKPVSFQQDGKMIATTFKINDNIVSFDVADYRGVLLIDPYIEWATFFGGAGYDDGSFITEDVAGNIYISSFTYSATNIATTGAYDVSYADSGDVYIAKFNSTGTLLWATYYGGTATDISGGIDYDNHGHIYISGGTNNATGIATLGSDQPVFAGPYVPDFFPQYVGDAFLVKFDTSGNRIWGTYFGGSDKETPSYVSCDTSGNVYMIGNTYSTSNISTIGAHQFNKAGSWNTTDCYIVKYNGTGQKLWATYYGGDVNDYCQSITIFHENKIYISGFTSSANNISTAGTYQTVLPSFQSGFIAALDANGSRLWGTYLGGSTSSAHTYLGGIACNASGDIFVTGNTDDPSGIATTGCHQAIYGGNGGPYLHGDGVVAKFDNTGNRIWGTYFGGSGGEYLGNIKCNHLGEIYFAGSTASPNNIALNALQGNYMGGVQSGSDGLLAKFTGNGTCIWSTYLGGTGDDYLGAIKISTNDYLYVTGRGTSFPTTVGSHQPNFAGGTYDSYLVKFKDFPTGIKSENVLSNTIKTYPIPNNGTFTIEGETSTPNQPITITISNISGQQIYINTFTTTGTQFKKQIELNNNTAPGIYTATIISNNTSTTHRFIKK